MQLYNLYRSNRKAVTCRILLLHKHTHSVRTGSEYDSTVDRDKINIRLINDDYIPVQVLLNFFLFFYTFTRSFIVSFTVLTFIATVSLYFILRTWVTLPVYISYNVFTKSLVLQCPTN